MNSRNQLRAIALLCASALVVACGGGGYGGDSNVAGIDRTGSPSFMLSFGTISGFGSIIVNGVHFETTSSTFTIDGASGSQDDLSVGDVVLVNATQAAGSTTWSATAVSFDDNVEGPISSIDPDARTIVVLGQTVQIIDGETSFDNSFANPSFEGLAVDQIVEVTGYVGSTGTIIATRIEPKAPGDLFEITGVVTGHEPGFMTFMINGLTVDYSGVLSLQNFPNGQIDVGQLVEAKGTDFDATSTTLTATFVEFKGDRIPGNANDLAEVEGLITRFGTKFDFDVSGIRVDATDAVFEGDEANIGLNVKVEVEGTIQEDANGKFIDARKVDVRRAKIVRIEAEVDSVSPNPDDPRIGTFVVLGIEVQVDLLTRMEDKFTNPPVEPFGLKDLSQGNYVRMRGSMLNDAGSSAALLAGLLERDDPRTDAELQGFVDNGSIDTNGNTFSILGVQINANTATQFRDADNNPIDNVDLFIDMMQDGDLVKVVGDEVPGVMPGETAIDARTLEFESVL